MPLNCPICDISLTQRSVSGQTIDECIVCGGGWYDSSELSMILRTAGKLDSVNRPSFDLPRTVQCPRCQSKITSSIYAHDSGIPILRCFKCSGAWLSAGQLAEISNYRNGPHKTDRLGHALAETYAPINQFNRLIGFLYSRPISLAFAAVIMTAGVLSGRNAADVLYLLAALLLPLACIWFPDSMGRFTGIRMGLVGPTFTQSTPGIAVAFGGWVLMFAVFAVILYQTL